MKTYTKEYCKQTLQEAFSKASEATAKHIESDGEGFLNCGFAWVTISPARGNLVKVLKDEFGVRGGQSYGSFGSPVAGITVYNPSKSYTQDVTAKEMGACAFAEVIEKYFPEYKVAVHSRLD